MTTVRLATNDLRFIVFGKPLSNIPITWAVSPTFKYHHVGTLRFETHENSYKYTPELIITLESVIYPRDIQPRAPNNGVWRMELCIPLREAYNILMEALPDIHAHLNGIK